MGGGGGLDLEMSAITLERNQVCTTAVINFVVVVQKNSETWTTWSGLQRRVGGHWEEVEVSVFWGEEDVLCEGADDGGDLLLAGVLGVRGQRLELEGHLVVDPGQNRHEVKSASVLVQAVRQGLYEP